jgi:hypothetical protein
MRGERRPRESGTPQARPPSTARRLTRSCRLWAASQAATNGLVLVLSVRLGTGDVCPVALAGAGGGGWLLAGDPLTATACVVGADLVAAAMMVPRTWRDPGSETVSTFAGASLAGALSALAVAAPDPSLLRRCRHERSACPSPHGRMRMIVFPLSRSVGLRAATASSRPATVPMLVRSRPSRTRWTISRS